MLKSPGLLKQKAGAFSLGREEKTKKNGYRLWKVPVFWE